MCCLGYYSVDLPSGVPIIPFTPKNYESKNKNENKEETNKNMEKEQKPEKNTNDNKKLPTVFVPTSLIINPIIKTPKNIYNNKYPKRKQKPFTETTVDSTHYTFSARNGTTSILDGSVKTEEGEERFQVRLSSAFSGEYLIVKNEEGATGAAAEEKKPETEELGEDMGLKPTENKVEEKEEEEEEEEEEELDLQSIMKFNFVNLTEGHFVSQGTWGENSVYQAIISNGAKPSFTMTIYKVVDGKATEYTTVLAKKVVARPEPSFMQKYGFLIMMGTMLLMTMSKNPSMAGGAGGAEGEGAGAAPAAAPAASN